MAEVNVRLDHPSPGIVYSEIHIPNEQDLGTGTYRTVLQPNVLDAPNPVISTAPPVSLIRLARSKKLLPSTTFPSVEALRDTVHEALPDLQDDIRRLGAYNGFWDQSYDGKKRGQLVPKKEIDIHSTLNLLLSDWALARSIEVIPENKTGVGDLAFSFVGSVEGQGPVSICTEVKRAHAKDLIHGLEVQLPAYMRRKQAPYGAYVVLWFKGGWFDRPTASTISRIRRIWAEADDESVGGELKDFEFALVSKAAVDPNLRNIQVFVIDVTKPVTASRV